MFFVCKLDIYHQILPEMLSEEDMLDFITADDISADDLLFDAEQIAASQVGASFHCMHTS